MKKSEMLFGEMHTIKEQIENPRLIARRVGSVEQNNKSNKAVKNTKPHNKVLPCNKAKGLENK